MVRLEATGTTCSGSSSLFQFLCGTIGSITKQRADQLFAISIPLWYDWKANCRQVIYGQENISIPLWYDWKRQLFTGLCVCPHISIPLWYYWKCRSFVNASFFYNWKSRRGRICPARSAISIPLWYDWKKNISANACIFPFISIPLWYDWKGVDFGDTLQVERYFNSSVVRLEVYCAYAVNAWHLNFNSSVVRLEGQAVGLTSKPTNISIPLWYDWK